MPTIIQKVYEQKTIELRSLKTERDKGQLFIYGLYKMLSCLSYDVSNKNIDRDFFKQS